MKPVIYARVSTEKQEKQETIQSQLVALREFAGGNGSAGCVEYADDGYTGELLARPGLDRLRDDAKKSLFDTVLVHSPDRLSRNFIHLSLLKEELTKAGIKIKYLNRPESKDTPEDKLLENVQGVIAEYEKAKILERTRRGRLHKAQSGFVIGGWAPYGYKYVLGDRNKKEHGHYEVVPEEARVVKLIFRMLVYDGLSVRGITKELVRRGISPRKGKCWRPGTIHRIVRNETYVGTTYYGKFASTEPKRRRTSAVYRRAKNTSKRLRPRDQWTPIPLPKSLEILDRKTFELAQRQLKINAERSHRNVKHDYLLRGLLKCGECGSPMYGAASRGKLFYQCGNRSRTFPFERECRGRSVKAERVEKAVWEKVCEAIAKPELIVSQIGKLKDRARAGQVALRTDLERTDKSLAAAEMEEDRLLDAYREEIISKDQLRDQIAKVNDKRARLSEEKQSIAAKLDGNAAAGFDKDDAAYYCETVRKRLDSLSCDFEGKSQVLNLLVNRAYLQGSTVRIKGIIPAGGDTHPDLAAGSTATLSPRCQRRNTHSFEFELEAALP